MTTVPGVGAMAAPAVAVPKALRLFCALGPPCNGPMYWPCDGLGTAPGGAIGIGAKAGGGYGAVWATARPPDAPRTAALANKILRIVSLLYAPATPPVLR